MPTTTPDATVYLICQPSVRGDGSLPDLSGLSEYGRVKVLLQGGEMPHRNPKRTMELLSERLQNYKPHRDFLVWAGGDTLSAVMIGYLLYENGWDRIQWLRFEKKREQGTGRRLDVGHYVRREIDLRDPQLELGLPHDTDEDDDDTV
jgi:hypothetical protein